MSLKMCGAVALAAGVMNFAVFLAPSYADTAKDAGGLQCYLLGCWDAAGNKVDADIKTASVATEAGQAIGAAKAARKSRSASQPQTKFGAIIARHAASHGVAVNLAQAVIRIESNFRVNARGAAGEIGLMQIKPATARMMGYSGSVKGLYDPETNIRYGMKYLAMAQRLGGGSLCGTILKYNAGHAAKRMNKVSSAYCSKVKRHMGAES
ncbi:MAG TPA: transglycosylase SLT domain-containing protein [Rhizobiaceae bacterium]|nr:transglycosylase SLT domain-containing protein [Rhizobiaceae bacterium]